MLEGASKKMGTLMIEPQLPLDDFWVGLDEA
jgi:hypothetical protein